MVRFNNQCAFCAFTMSDVHHITPRSKGGNNAPENLIVLCPNHHRLCHHGLLAETTMREQVQKVLQQHQ
jgi:5-methylcytosine-specific restriction endonuclease McrA